ncbi:hypothetical protein AA313_de0205452 [Arthrobotrys entomopaga]|nr:hypothetical protein AA313_de0205452 [Arthrobotrys entomopaga]
MSLRHTLRTLLNGPQTQEPAPAGQYGYVPNQQQPQPLSHPPSQPPSHYGAPQYGQSQLPFGYTQAQTQPQPQFHTPSQAPIHNPMPQGPPAHTSPYAPPPHGAPIAAQAQQPYTGAGTGYPQQHFQQPTLNYAPAPHQVAFDHTAKPPPVNQTFQLPPTVGVYNSHNNLTNFGGPQNPSIYRPQFSASPIQQNQYQTQPQTSPSPYAPLSPVIPSIQGQPNGPQTLSNLHYAPPSVPPPASPNTQPPQTPSTPQFAPQSSPIKEQFSHNQYPFPPSFSQPSTVPNSPFIPNSQRIPSPIPQNLTSPTPAPTVSGQSINQNLNYQPASPSYAPVSTENPPQQPSRQSSFGTEIKSPVPGSAPQEQHRPLEQTHHPSQTPSHEPLGTLSSSPDPSSTGHGSILAASPLTANLPPDIPSGIIHPSMLKQWSRTNTLNSIRIPTPPIAQSDGVSNLLSAPPSKTPDLPIMLSEKSPNLPIFHSGETSSSPSMQPQVSPRPPSPKPPSPEPFGFGLPPQSAYPGGKSHGPQASVSRSFTFAKKNADGSPNWSGILLTIDGVTAETFTRFIDGMYNFAGQETDPLGLTPDQIRLLFERLDMPDDKNHPKRLGLVANKMNHSDTVSFVNTNLIQCYTIFDLTYITEPNLMPIVTREGFEQYVISQVLIDPSAMHARFNKLLANFGNELVDPPTKKPFGNVEIDRACFPAVPNDQYVAREKKQMEALLAIEAANQNDKPQSGDQGTFKHQSSWGI